MVLVSGVLENGDTDLTGILFGLGAAVLYAVVVILNKKNPVENAYGKTMVQLFVSAAVLFPYLLLTEDVGSFSLGGTEIAMLLIVGIVHTGIAYAMYFGSVQNLPSQTVAVFSYGSGSGTGRLIVGRNLVSKRINWCSSDPGRSSGQ